MRHAYLSHTLSQEFYLCRKPERVLNSCVFEKLVSRSPARSAVSCGRSAAASMELQGKPADALPPLITQLCAASPDPHPSPTPTPLTCRAPPRFAEACQDDPRLPGRPGPDPREELAGVRRYPEVRLPLTVEAVMQDLVVTGQAGEERQRASLGGGCRTSGVMPESITTVRYLPWSGRMIFAQSVRVDRMRGGMAGQHQSVLTEGEDCWRGGDGERRSARQEC